MSAGQRRDGPQELADQLMGVLLAAVRRLREVGMSEAEIVAYVRSRLDGPMSPAEAEAEIDRLVEDALGRL